MSEEKQNDAQFYTGVFHSTYSTVSFLQFNVNV